MQKENNIEEILEKIVFDKDNLAILKTAINKVDSGEISSKELRQQIIELRTRLLNRLIKYIPFYLKLVTTKKSLGEFSKDKTNTTQLQQELQERNELLKKVGSCINKIYFNLINDKNLNE
ncbi:MAG: hypothetical protein ACFFDN_25255 [Candidatus Hodarchaeota archaeon]